MDPLTIFFWLARWVIGIALGVGGLHLLGVDLVSIGFLKGVGGVMLLALGFAVMPDIGEKPYK